MKENPELIDIILTTPDDTLRKKRVLLALSTLSVILIIVIMIVSSLTGLQQAPVDIQLKETFKPDKNYAIKQGYVTFYVDSYKMDDNKCVVFEDTTLCGPVSITNNKGN